jgi:hypothetical protein
MRSVLRTKRSSRASSINRALARNWPVHPATAPLRECAAATGVPCLIENARAIRASEVARRGVTGLPGYGVAAAPSRRQCRALSLYSGFHGARRHPFTSESLPPGEGIEIVQRTGFPDKLAHPQATQLSDNPNLVIRGPYFLRSALCPRHIC